MCSSGNGKSDSPPRKTRGDAETVLSVVATDRDPHAHCAFFCFFVFLCLLFVAVSFGVLSILSSRSAIIDLSQVNSPIPTFSEDSVFPVCPQTRDRNRRQRWPGTSRSNGVSPAFGWPPTSELTEEVDSATPRVMEHVCRQAGLLSIFLPVAMARRHVVEAFAAVRGIVVLLCRMVVLSRRLNAVLEQVAKWKEKVALTVRLSPKSSD